MRRTDPLFNFSLIARKPSQQHREFLSALVLKYPYAADAALITRWCLTGVPSLSTLTESIHRQQQTGYHQKDNLFFH